MYKPVWNFLAFKLCILCIYCVKQINLNCVNHHYVCTVVETPCLVGGECKQTVCNGDYLKLVTMLFVVYILLGLLIHFLLSPSDINLNVWGHL